MKDKLNRIFDNNAVINWMGRYILSFVETQGGNPLLEWQGYAIDEINIGGYRSIFKSTSLVEALDKFIEIIESESFCAGTELESEEV